jgi:two-component system chemotaxis sensor kinase CheA
MIFNPIDLADDPVYRDMFATLASETLLEMRQTLNQFDEKNSQSELREQAEHINFAAQQLNFLEWEKVLEEFLSSSTFEKSDAKNVFEQLKNLLLQDFGKKLPAQNESAYALLDGVDANNLATPEIANFFDEIKKPLQLVKAVYDSAEFNSPQFITALEEIKNLAEPLDFVQLVSLIDEFIEPNRNVALTHQNVQDFLFWLFEALIAIENVIFEGQSRVNSHTQTMLGYLCSKHVFANLLIINNILDSIKNRSNVEYNCTRINEALRKIYYACQHYGLDTAAQLSMSLMDLFARITNGDMVIDGFMLHIAKSFVSGIELVLSSLESGIAPDMGQIEKLLDDATSAVFVSSGAVVSASMIEARLGLPPSFHKILTTESVKIAADDLEANKHFFIVRTDLEQDEELATNFLTWVSSDSVTAISNVTVFESNRTLFDFLISTNLNPIQFRETLINLDHSGKSLFVTHVLEDHKTVGDETNRLRQRDELAQTTNGLPATNQGQMSCDMLESIGELVTNQAMMRHLLHDLVEEDLAKNIDVKLNSVDGNWMQAKDDVRQYLLLWQDKIEKLIQIEVQTNALMEQLQEEAIAGRMRSAMQLLKPLFPFVESTSRQKNRLVEFTTQGEDVSLDFTMLENLKVPLRTLLTFCMTQSIETQEQRVENGKNEQAKLRVVLIENDDHVKIIIEDDGIGIDTKNVAQRTAQIGLANQLESIFSPVYGVTCNDENSENGVDFSKMRDTLQLHGGNIWVTNLPTGGLRLTLTMSLTMLLLEGMVVRINAVHYVIPIDAIQRIIRIDKTDLMSVSADDGGFMLHLGNNDTIPVQFLKGNHQEINEINAFGDDEKQLFVVIGKESKRVAIKVSELIGQQNVLSRPLQGYLSHIRGVIGCTLLGSSDVGLVLDVNAIFGG